MVDIVLSSIAKKDVVLTVKKSPGTVKFYMTVSTFGKNSLIICYYFKVFEFANILYNSPYGRRTVHKYRCAVKYITCGFFCKLLLY